MDSTLKTLRQRAANASPEERRQYLLWGVGFARMTIQNRTEIAERAFTQWREKGTLTKNLNLWETVGKSLASAQNLTVDDSERLWAVRKTPQAAERLLVSLVWGIGVPKAHFALACAGFGKGGCIDSRIGNKHADKIVGLGVPRSSDGLGWVWHPSGPGWQRYAAACEAIWGRGDQANKQWVEWLRDMRREGRTTAHDCLL